jgi:saccharopine dehydrogenase-like NADP-dependent oxidoreductase
VTLCFIEYEPVFTLPRFIGKGVSYVDCKISLEPNVAALHLMGLANDKPIEVKGIKIAPKDVLLSLLPKPADLAGKVEGHSCIAVEVAGRKAGRNMRVLAYAYLSHQEAYKKYGVTATSYLTGTPPAIGAVMLAKGDIKVRGVIPPECLEPQPLLAKIEKKGIKITERFRVVRV